MKDIFVPFVFVMILIFAVMVVFGVPLTLIDRGIANTSCNAFERESGYNTRFVSYTFFTYDCLAEQENGKWISTSLLREVSGNVKEIK